MKTSNMLALPTEDSIAGWQNGFDGVTYLIEHATPTSYSSKSYWTPRVQSSLKEALLFSTVVDSTFKLANAKTAWKEFSREILFLRVIGTEDQGL